MHDNETRAAFQKVLKRETDPAARRWLRVMIRGELPDKRPRKRKPARKRKRAA